MNEKILFTNYKQGYTRFTCDWIYVPIFDWKRILVYFSLMIRLSKTDIQHAVIDNLRVFLTIINECVVFLDRWN